MAMPSISASSPANNKPAGFQAVFIRPNGEKYQTLGAISGGELKFTDFNDSDDMGRNRSIGSVGFTAKCRMMQSSLTEIELIDSIIAGTSAFLFKLSDAAAIPTSGAAATEGWVVVAATQVGCKAKVVANGDPSKNRYIELEWKGSMLLSERDAAIKASIDDDEFESSADAGTFHAVGTYSATKNGGLPTPSHIKPCGVSSVVLTAAGGAGNSAILSPVKNSKIEFDFLADEDDKLRFLPCSISADIAYEWMDTSSTNLLLLDSMVDLDIKVVINAIDGLVWTLDNVVGIHTEVESVGSFDKNRVVRFTHKGKMLTTSFDGIVA